MDVLVYSALNEQAALKKEVAEKQACLFDLKQNASSGGGGAAGDAESCAKAWLTSSSAADSGGEKYHWKCPGDTTKWGIYEGDGWTGNLKVCDDTGYYRCGRSCTWTVPGGATKARFQLWGAGGGANKAPCCCGHTPFGSTGSYASVIIPVTSGHSYTLCSGCAYCCYGYTTSGSQRLSGCPSYVQGCHLCWFCADGGQGSLGNWMGMMDRCLPYKLSYYNNNQEGYCICNTGGDWCSSNSYQSGNFTYIAGSGYHGTIMDIDEPDFENVIYGLRGIWPEICYDTNHYGYDVHAPIKGFEADVICCATFSSGNCCGKQCGAWQGNGCLRYPGAGGWSSHAMGGGNGLCGDSGKFGMVCVQWQ
tara:strand:- start:175 stop:1260 length:1086 start_codon:yes stop_codon:yes gene_type:complete